MLNTAKELHIGIDIGLQSISSNRKLSIEPAEKDWVLNTVMIQEINNKINPKSNIKGEGFEETVKRIDDLESIKEDSSEILNLPIYKFSDYASYVPLPPDYHRLIEASVNVNNHKSISSPTVKLLELDSYSSVNSNKYKTLIAKIKLPSTSTDNYTNLKVMFQYDVVGAIGSETYSEEVLFDLNEVGEYYSYNIGTGIEEYFLHGINPMYAPYSESKFQVIRLIMDYINADRFYNGVSVYWERYGDIYEKDNFIFVLDVNTAVTNLSIDDQLTSRIIFAPGGEPFDADNRETVVYNFESPYAYYNDKYYRKFDTRFLSDSNFYTTAEKALYDAVNFSTQPVRIVKSSEFNRLNKHYYGKTNYESPLATIKKGRLVIYHDGTFEFNRINFEYYRKPRLISILNNQGCEITSDSFRMELIDKTVQKLSARIQDPNYKNILQENLILE